MLLKPGGGGSTVITASSRAAASERRVQEKPTRRSKSPTRGVRHTAPPPEYSKPLVKASVRAAPPGELPLSSEMELSLAMLE